MTIPLLDSSISLGVLLSSVLMYQDSDPWDKARHPRKVPVLTPRYSEALNRWPSGTAKGLQSTDQGAKRLYHPPSARTPSWEEEDAPWSWRLHWLVRGGGGLVISRHRHGWELTAWATIHALVTLLALLTTLLTSHHQGDCGGSCFRVPPGWGCTCAFGRTRLGERYFQVRLLLKYCFNACFPVQSTVYLFHLSFFGPHSAAIAMLCSTIRIVAPMLRGSGASTLPLTTSYVWCYYCLARPWSCSPLSLKTKRDSLSSTPPFRNLPLSVGQASPPLLIDCFLHLCSNIIWYFIIYLYATILFYFSCQHITLYAIRVLWRKDSLNHLCQKWSPNFPSLLSSVDSDWLPRIRTWILSGTPQPAGPLGGSIRRLCQWRAGLLPIMPILTASYAD